MKLLNFQRYFDLSLVGGAITILKNMKVNGKDDIPYMKWNIIQPCLKPPTRSGIPIQNPTCSADLDPRQYGNHPQDVHPRTMPCSSTEAGIEMIFV